MLKNGFSSENRGLPIFSSTQIFPRPARLPGINCPQTS